MSGLLSFLIVAAALLAAVALYVVGRSTVVIGPAQIGLVIKRISRRHNITDTPIAMHGEAGYQGELLMPGVRFKLLADLCSCEVPLGSGPRGRDRSRGLADRRSAADRR